MSVNQNVSGIENPNIGSRATSMGGNYRSIANDWSAMYWNPAGLSFSEGLNTGLSMEYVILRGDFTPGNSYYYNQNGGEEFQPFSATYTTTRDAEPLNFLVPSFGITYSPGGKWSYGMGVWVTMALGTKWDLLDTEGNSNGRGIYNATYPKYEYENNVQVIDLHPTVSYKITDKLSVGMGVSILFGKVAIRRPAFLQNPYLYNIEELENLNISLYDILLRRSDQSQTETLNQMRLSPYDHIINEVEMNGSGMTFGGNFGLMYKPNNKISIGASIQINKALEVSGDYKQSIYFSDNAQFNTLAKYYYENYLSNYIDNFQLDEQYHDIISNLYSGDILSLVDTMAKTTVPLPLKAGMGISYSGIENLILSADVNFMNWSDWDALVVKTDNDSSISELILNWENSVKIGIGAEYATKIATLRAGYSFETHPPVDGTISPAIPEIGNRNNLDIGVAFNLFGGQLSFNYHKIFIAEHTVESWSYDPIGVALNMAGTYNINVQSLMIGYDIKF